MKVHIAGIPDNMIANNLTSSYAIHPGEIIKDELEARGITQKQLADETGIPISVLNAVLEGKRDVTTEYALLFEAALDIDADFWLRFQSDYNKQIIKSNPDFMSRLKNVRKIVAAL
ncbi:MAG: HigA family addiction module antidote protein [Muribaculaceae bacterium]|nr:HigA family addiction module antidote protein [Muribaculaceae bacterium]